MTLEPSVENSILPESTFGQFRISRYLLTISSGFPVHQLPSTEE